MTYDDQRPQAYPGGYFQPQTTGGEYTQPVPQQYGQQAFAPQQGRYVPAPGAQPYYPQPPVVVNVTQNAGGRVPMRKGLNHLLHWTLTFFTGGLWLIVYIPLLLKRRKIVYR